MVAYLYMKHKGSFHRTVSHIARSLLYFSLDEASGKHLFGEIALCVKSVLR